MAIENLMKKKGKFDYILLETTGLADPGPIASIFWMDDDLGSDIYLDGIVTLVDSLNVRKVTYHGTKIIVVNYQYVVQALIPFAPFFTDPSTCSVATRNWRRRRTTEV